MFHYWIPVRCGRYVWPEGQENAQMGRKATIWFSLDRRPGGYFTGAGGKKQLLYKCREDDESTNGPNYRRAMKAFTTLLENLAEPDPFDQTFALCLERWYRHLEESCPATGKQARSLFRDLCDRLGHVEIPDLKGKWLLDYVRDRESWNDNTKASALKRLNGCFRWCLEEEHCSVNPLRGVKVNRAFRETARGEECVLPVALEHLLITNGRPAWRGFAVALSRTGARPGELANAERKHYYPADHVIILKDHKTAKRLKRADKRRIIHLDPEVEAIIRENLKRGDRLFPTTTGNKWDGKE